MHALGIIITANAQIIPEDGVIKLFPNELLGSGHTEEVVAMSTAQQERYTCVLPKSHAAEETEVGHSTPHHLTRQWSHIIIIIRRAWCTPLIWMHSSHALCVYAYNHSLLSHPPIYNHYDCF